MEDALISPESFSILSGAGLIDATEKEPVYVHTTYDYEVEKANTIVLPEKACWNKYDREDPDFHTGADIFVMLMNNGKIEGEPCVPYAVADDHKTITCYSHSGQIDVGDIVKVDFYVKRTTGAQMMEISADQFGGNYYLEAQTLFRDEDTGVDMPAEFIIPNCKVQSNFTFSMAATGDPSTFTFTLDAFPDYTKFKKTKKVLAALQVITEAVDSADDTRAACVPQSVDTITDGISVSFDNNSTDDDCRITVTGNNVNGTVYDRDWWGDKLNNAAELEIVMPVYENGTYRLVTQNPMLKYYEGDEGIEKKDGVWIKDKTYDITDGSLTLRTAITDEKGAIIVKLFDENDEIIKTFHITNKVSFAKTYNVRINNDSDITVDGKKLNEKDVEDFGKVVTGDVICLELSGNADVTAIGGTVDKTTAPIYTVTAGSPASGTVIINIAKI